MKQTPPPPPDETPDLPPDPPPPPPPARIPYHDADISTRYDDVFQEIVPDEVQTVRWMAGAYELVCRNGVALRIQVLSSGILRLRYSPNGEWERDFSYAVDPAFEPSKVTVTLNENANEYILASDLLQVVVTKQGLRVRIFDLDDHLLCEDADGFLARRTVMNGWEHVQITQACHRKSLFYGLGDKASEGANLHGKTFENWCTDSFAFGRDSDTLYRAIPFYYAVQHGAAHGIFLDNTFRTSFDFNSKDEGAVTLAAAGGEMNYYFLYGPRLADVARQYHLLTGAHPLPPMWALGYHQSKWGYYPEQVVRDLAASFRREQIPCDAVYLDIDYMDGYRCFTWNEKYFPDPKKMIQDLDDQGFNTVVMIDPGLKEDPNYTVYREALERGFLLKTADGAVAKGPVWPGFCGFPDFTHPDVRAWWGNLYRTLYVEQGVSGFWNDMNEPAVFHVNHKTLPDHVMHHFDGAPTSHRRAHNVYGQQMARASWEGFERLQPEKRPFLLTRASYAGGQRFAAVWTGDNCASWEHLQIANIQCQRLAMSGFSLCGTDIGGFAGEPDGELYTRWLQLAVFHPVMRAHSMGSHASGDSIEVEEAHDLIEEVTHPETAIAAEKAPQPEPKAPAVDGQEPWAFGEKWTEIARKAIELRYCLLPVLYTAMWRNRQDGTPVLRHLAFADELDPKLWDQERDFLFGEHLLVSPVVQSKVQRQMVYLPRGDWYYFWTGQPANGEMFVNVMPDQIPFFVRAGAVLPVYPVRQHTREEVDERTLYIYHKNGSEVSTLYEDSGEGFDYQQDKFRLLEFEVQGDTQQLTLTMQKSGTWSPVSQKVKIYLVGFPTFVRTCQVDGVEMPIKEIRLRDRSLYTLSVEPTFKTITWHA